MRSTYLRKPASGEGEHGKEILEGPARIGSLFFDLNHMGQVALDHAPEG